MPTIRSEVSGRLLDILKSGFPEWKTGTLKQKLKAGLVLVNGILERSGGATVDRGSNIEILSRPAGSRVAFPSYLGEPPLTILYSDEDLLAVDKPHGLLSVASLREKNLTAIRLMRDWLSGLGTESRDSLHAAHRLDRDASGVLLLARSPEVKKRLAADWHRFEKVYLAVTDGVPEEKEGTIDVPLWEDKGLFVRTAEQGDGESAFTSYRVVKTKGTRALLEVRLGSGRKHQIRVHLAHIGCPIVGDVRYGKSKARRLCLHASLLELFHPHSGKKISIASPMPAYFRSQLAKVKNH